jgi:glutathione synthase/RimK-type ligase-like ATP-grasp enzyme
MKQIKPKRLKVRKNRLILWAAKGMFKSARKLADAIKPDTQRKVLIVRSDSLKFKPRETDVIVNWGNRNRPAFYDTHVQWEKHFNDIACVAQAVNKLWTFQALTDKCNIPEWTTDPAVCYEWLTQKYEVQALARKTLTGFGGDGIEEIMGGTEYGPEGNAFPQAPLYVQYKKKKKEFRVHVFKGEVIDITQKKKRKDFEGEVNTKIRNYANGWVYCREDIVEPDDLREQATLAIGVLGLDFGAVDCIWNEKENKTYILEANTAPGLEGTTIEVYKNAILKNLQ